MPLGRRRRRVHEKGREELVATRRSPPGWYWIVVVVLLLWQAIGVWSFYEHVAHGPAAMGAVPTEYDRQYFAAIPGWYNWVYGIAVWGALAVGAALLRRHRAAIPLAIVSLVAIVIMFGWNFLATDLIAAKGVWVTYFPAAIFAMGVFTWWFARTARARGWIG